MQLSENFTLEELTASQEAVRHNIDNTPEREIVERLVDVAERLEAIRRHLGHPIIISSGYRSKALNKALGGVANSAHCYGYAADFICPAFGTPYQVAGAILAADIKFDQLIMEGNWVHISFAPPLRQQVLTATFKGNVASYSQGLRGFA